MFSGIPFTIQDLTDLYDIRIRSIEGKRLEFQCLTSGASDLDNLEASRSFVLVAMWQALRKASRRAKRTEGGEARAAGYRAQLSQAPLLVELGRRAKEQADWFVDEYWMIDHVGDFVDSTRVLERRNHLPLEELEAREREIVEAVGGDLLLEQESQWGPMRWDRLHSYRVAAVVTEARWLEHLHPGMEFGTTAYDVWHDDDASYLGLESR